MNTKPAALVLSLITLLCLVAPSRAEEPAALPAAVPAPADRSESPALPPSGPPAATPALAPAADGPAGVAAPGTPRFLIGFLGGLTSGRITAAGAPKEGGYAPSMVESSGYFVGVSGETPVDPSFSLFFDGMAALQKTPVASQGGYATGIWVFEQTGYSSHAVGPFATDVNAFIQSAGFRLGAKYFVGGSGMLRPWIGAGYGFYSWSFDYANTERNKSYGKASGTAGGLTYLVGVNFEVSEDTVLSLYGDFTSPVINPRIENLFRNGWTWENPGGNHLMGPYRFAVALQFSRF